MGHRIHSAIVSSRRVRVAAATAAGLALLLGHAPAARGHGSLEAPPSRTYACYFLDRTNPMCAQAWSANPQALYDWMEVNLGDANGQHTARIPDGHLCSAGRAKYAAFDAPGTGWPTTEIRPDSDGLYTLVWNSTAPHSTAYYRLYLTREGFDPWQPPRWADLELVYDSGPGAAVHPVVLRTALPRRSGHAILYVVWQRDDSPEAFYSCSDVVFGDGVSTTPPPTPAPPPVVALTLASQSDWGSGYCMTATVSTTASQRIDWTVDFHLHDTITTTWNAQIVQHGHLATATGLEWNYAVSAAQPQSFGFCATRHMVPSAVPTATPTPAAMIPTATRSPTRTPTAGTAATRTATATRTASPTRTATVRRTATPSPRPTASTTPAVHLDHVVTSDWGAGYCAAVTLTTPSTTPVDWRVRFPIEGRVHELWSAHWSQSGTQVTAEGLSWNDTVRQGGPVHFGYCARR